MAYDGHPSVGSPKIGFAVVVVYVLLRAEHTGSHAVDCWVKRSRKVELAVNDICIVGVSSVGRGKPLSRLIDRASGAFAFELTL